MNFVDFSYSYIQFIYPPTHPLSLSTLSLSQYIILVLKSEHTCIHEDKHNNISHSIINIHETTNTVRTINHCRLYRSLSLPHPPADKLPPARSFRGELATSLHNVLSHATINSSQQLLYPAKSLVAR